MVYNSYFCADCQHGWGSSIARENEARSCNKCGEDCLPVKRGPSKYKCDECDNEWTSVWGGVKECRSCSRKNIPIPDEDTSSDSESDSDDDGDEEQGAKKEDEEKVNTSKLKQKELELEEARKKLARDRAEFEAEKEKTEEEIHCAKSELIRKKGLLQQELVEMAKEKGSLRAEKLHLEKERSAINEEKERLMLMEVNLKKKAEKKPATRDHESSAEVTEPDSTRQNRQKPESDQAASRHTDAMKCKEKGDKYRAGNKLHAAIEQYTMAIGMKPKDGSFYTSRSVTYMELGIYQDGLGDANKAVDLDPTNIEAKKRYVECLLALGEGALAERACRQLRESAPHLPDVPEMLQKSVEIRVLRDAITTCIARSEYQEAAGKLNQVLAKCVQCAELLILKAEVLVNLGKYAEADEVLSKINREDDPNLRFVRALTLYKQFKLPEAVKELKSLLTRIAGDAKVLRMYKMCKKIKELVEKAEEASANNELETAVNNFTDALAVDADSDTVNASLFRRRGHCLHKLKKYEEAISDYTQTIKSDAKASSRVFRLRGQCYTKLSNYEAAMDDYEIAFRLDKKDQTKKTLDDVTKKFEEQEAKKTNDHYAVLEVPRTATVPDIKKAYMKLARLHHPDRHSDALPSAKLREERRFKLINEAYNTLSDPEKRKKYDRKTR